MDYSDNLGTLSACPCSPPRSSSLDYFLLGWFCKASIWPFRMHSTAGCLGALFCKECTWLRMRLYLFLRRILGLGWSRSDFGAGALFWAATQILRASTSRCGSNCDRPCSWLRRWWQKYWLWPAFNCSGSGFPSLQFRNNYCIIKSDFIS